MTTDDAFNKTFDVALHAGTLLAAIAFFRLEVWRLIVAFVAAARKQAIETDEERLAAIVLLLRQVGTTSYRPFVLYRDAAGIAILIVIAAGLRPATF